MMPGGAGSLGKRTLPEPRDKHGKRSIDQNNNSEILKRDELFHSVEEFKETLVKRYAFLEQPQKRQWELERWRHQPYQPPPFEPEAIQIKRNNMDTDRRTLWDSLNQEDKRHLDQDHNPREIAKRQKIFYHVLKDVINNPNPTEKPGKAGETFTNSNEGSAHKEKGVRYGPLSPPPFLAGPVRFKRSDVDIIRRTLPDSSSQLDKRDLKRSFPKEELQKCYIKQRSSANPIERSPFLYYKNEMTVKNPHEVIKLGNIDIEKSSHGRSSI